jgi:hypothetical protein
MLILGNMHSPMYHTNTGIIATKFPNPSAKVKDLGKGLYGSVLEYLCHGEHVVLKSTLRRVLSKVAATNVSHGVASSLSWSTSIGNMKTSITNS